ncbi:hypothetical protein [Candidatus Poriferisodalis sp.]|uniref:hypothetical protein n=1 Tax=Candidatus Poriferisodalis sp. TaxID=3101277 RepID=UPI003D0F12CE
MNIIRRRKSHRTFVKESGPPQRIRAAARVCAWLGILLLVTLIATAVLGGGAYTDTVGELRNLNIAVALVAAIMLLMGTAVLRALADLYEIADKSVTIRVPMAVLEAMNPTPRTTSS